MIIRKDGYGLQTRTNSLLPGLPISSVVIATPTPMTTSTSLAVAMSGQCVERKHLAED
ncbi:MAG: hypothetical protein GY775_20160 [Candidatus Scalindua sp.]|nr:hypothetical protein [Candidatus Scalindua sp.]